MPHLDFAITCCALYIVLVAFVTRLRPTTKRDVLLFFGGLLLFVLVAANYSLLARYAF